MPDYYQHEARIDALTGDYAHDDSVGDVEAGHPLGQILALCLRTPRGSALRDPGYGLNLIGVNTNARTAAREVERRTREALSRWVTSGDLEIVAVRVEVRGGAFWIDVDYRDPHDPTTKPLTVTARRS